MMMSNSSNLVRRSAQTIMVTRRPLTAQALAKVQDFESVLNNLHWTSTKNNVEEIRHLMGEYRTNHAIAVPDARLEDQVCSRMGTIRSQLSSSVHSINRSAIDAEIFGLKRMVKSELYAR